MTQLSTWNTRVFLSFPENSPSAQELEMVSVHLSSINCYHLMRVVDGNLDCIGLTLRSISEEHAMFNSMLRVRESLHKAAVYHHTILGTTAEQVLSKQTAPTYLESTAAHPSRRLRAPALAQVISLGEWSLAHTPA